MGNEYLGVWRDVIMAYFKAPTTQSPGETERISGVWRDEIVAYFKALTP